MQSSEKRFARHAASLVSRRMRTFRVVVVGGPRQAGKTTLLELVPELGPERLVTFDRPDLLARATEDPLGFVSGFPNPLAIDEFQRAGNDLLLAVKYVVDRNDARGQFVLAGSTNFLANRRLAETLAGRVGLVQVLPLSRGEVLGVTERFVDRVFDSPRSAAEAARKAEKVDRKVLAHLISIGGFPEALRFSDSSDRTEFFRAYLDTVTGRESLEDVGAMRTRSELRQMLSLVAARTANEYQPTTLAGEAGLTRQTIAAYVELLRALYLVVLLPPWASSATTRARRSSKVHLVDCGLATALMATTEEAMRRPDHRSFGSLLETFVATELVKSKEWAATPVDLLHFRDGAQHEVDLILESGDGRFAGIEVKGASAVGPRAFDHLRYLRDRHGERFIGGYVLYGGNEVWEHSDRLWAFPISALWAE